MFVILWPLAAAEAGVLLGYVAMLCTGVRQLLEEKMHELILFINSLMRDSTINPFSYLSASSSRILSGEEEGAFQWITVNYLLGSFASESTYSTLHTPLFQVTDHHVEQRSGRLCLTESLSIWHCLSVRTITLELNGL